MATTSPLRQRMIDDMRVRNLSPATQRSYIHAVSESSRYFGRSPTLPGVAELRDMRSISYQRRFPGGAEPDRERLEVSMASPLVGRMPERIPYARKPKKLPVILSAEEAVRFFKP